MIVTGERGIPVSTAQVEPINEAMYVLVCKLNYEKTKEEYFQNKSEQSKKERVQNRKNEP